MSSNDEPVFEDVLGHYQLVRRLGHRILRCKPPYVIGVCGSWGSGKTSFLKMLWAYLGGEFEIPPARKSKCLDVQERLKWYEETDTEFTKRVDKRKLELIWFNPWQHQFESSPLVGLLYEIRQHFTLKRRLFDKAGKLADVSIHATLNALAEFGKELKIPIPSAKGIMERGREYESEHFSTALTSQRFREFFEGAIRAVTEEKGKEGLLVIFIDDLDRCEGDVAYRLMEALKLYINAGNCVFVLGLDQQHLESSIAKALSGEKETFRYRPLARDYLNKIFQNLFLLPVPREISRYVHDLLDHADVEFTEQLNDLFGLADADFPKLVAALDENLPHNPRKAKSFISSWKLHLDVLPRPSAQELRLDWRLSFILHYLAQFEEPLFRKVEEAPAFYSDHIVKFCRTGFDAHPLFDGLERPYDTPLSSSSVDQTGGLGTSPGSSPPSSPTTEQGKVLAEPRILWISRLVNQLATDTSFTIGGDVIHRHLVRTGGKPVGV